MEKKRHKYNKLVKNLNKNHKLIKITYKSSITISKIKINYKYKFINFNFIILKYFSKYHYIYLSKNQLIYF